jgi:YD repeat-containing protein
MIGSRKRITCALASLALIVGASPAVAGTVNYSYDEQGRIATATYPDGTCATYVYDKAGNRTHYTVSATGCANLVIAGPVSAAVAENSSNNPISLNITGGIPTSVAVSSGASHGSASAIGASIRYTPNGGYLGPDSFQYTATNSYGTSAPGTVSLTVAAPDGTVLYTASNPGPYSYTVPAGVAYVDIEGWGAGYPGFALNPNQLSGGGGGGYFKKHIAVSQGQVITGSISPPPAPMSSGLPTPAGPVTVTSPVNLSAAAGALPSGGTASGGDVNTTGRNCCITYFYSGGGAGNGGGDQNAISGPGTTPGGGGAGAYPLGSLGPAAAGQIRITARTS